MLLQAFSPPIEVSTAGSVQVGTWIDHSTWAKHRIHLPSILAGKTINSYKFEVVGAIHGVPYGSLWFPGLRTGG